MTLANNFQRPISSFWCSWSGILFRLDPDPWAAVVVLAIESIRLSRRRRKTYLPLFVDREVHQDVTLAESGWPTMANHLLILSHLHHVRIPQLSWKANAYAYLLSFCPHQVLISSSENMLDFRPTMSTAIPNSGWAESLPSFRYRNGRHFLDIRAHLLEVIGATWAVSLSGFLSDCHLSKQPRWLHYCFYCVLWARI